MKRHFGQTESIHLGSATRAPVDAEQFTGDDRLTADVGSRGRPDPRAGNDFTVEEGGEVTFSQPGRDDNLSCPGCGKSPGKGEGFALSGPSKGRLRKFVQEKRECFLERMGISFSP